MELDLLLHSIPTKWLMPKCRQQVNVAGAAAWEPLVRNMSPASTINLRNKCEGIHKCISTPISKLKQVNTSSSVVSQSSVSVVSNVLKPQLLDLTHKLV
jgi:hypothetical protein